MADNGDKFFKGLIFGGIIGGILGVLYAPKSGRETREELSGESEKLLNQFKTDIENAKKAALKSFDQGKDLLIEKLANDEDVTEAATPDLSEKSDEEKRPKEKDRQEQKPKKKKTLNIN